MLVNTAVGAAPPRLSPSFSQLVRLRLCGRPGAFAAVATAIGKASDSLGAWASARVARLGS